MIASVNFNSSHHTDMSDEPFVELHFPVKGNSLPADHGYALFAACVHHNPVIRQQQTLSILTIPGFPNKQGKILLTKDSHLRIRTPVTQIPLIYGLAGKSLNLGGHEIKIGIPKIFMLKPASELKSRIVVIKGHSEPESFLKGTQRQLDELGISAQISISKDQKGEYCRKTIKVKRYTVVGFTTEVSSLSDEDSLKLQQ